MSTGDTPTVRGVAISSPTYCEETWFSDPRAERNSPTDTLPRNVSEVERLVSIGGGATLALWGLSQGRLSGLVAMGTGVAMVYRGLTGHCHLYNALGVTTAEQRSETAIPAQQGVRVSRSIIVDRPAEDLFRYWRDVKNLPQVMRQIVSVEPRSHRLSHWTAAGPLGISIEWDAEIFNERYAELIAWRSLPGGALETAGSVHFEELPHGVGTRVNVNMKYNPPAGSVGDRVASIFGRSLDQEVAADLLRFKMLMEDQ